MFLDCNLICTRLLASFWVTQCHSLQVSKQFPYLAFKRTHRAADSLQPSSVLLFLHVASRRCFSHSNDSTASTLARSIQHCFHPIPKVDLLFNLLDEFLDGNNCLIMIKSGNQSKDDWLCNESWDKEGIMWNLTEYALLCFCLFTSL